MTATDYPQKLSAENSPSLHYSTFRPFWHAALFCKSITYDWQNLKIEVKSAKLGLAINVGLAACPALKIPRSKSADVCQSGAYAVRSPAVTRHHTEGACGFFGTC